jgi:uncharacterized protein with HEPN domain
MKRVDVLLSKMLGYARQVREFIRDTGEDNFYANVEKKYAVCLALLQIGELVTLLPDDFRAANPDVPWKGIRGLRNIIAHDYGSIDDRLLWRTAHLDMPIFIEFLESTASNDETTDRAAEKLAAFKRITDNLKQLNKTEPLPPEFDEIISKGVNFSPETKQ